MAVFGGSYGEGPGYPVEILHFYTFNALVSSLPRGGEGSHIANGKEELPPPQELRVDYWPINIAFILLLYYRFLR